MPYIKLTERPKFQAPIADVLGILKDPNDALYVKGEYFGFFVNRAVKRFLGDPRYVDQSFNSAFFNEAKKKTLANAADSVASAINKADPIATAGELNYAISAVLWGFLGDAEGFQSASYGMRTYVRAMLERVLSSIETVNVGSQRDMAMAFRRHLVIRGVLGDIVSETYRLKTVPYEEGKILQNGEVWQEGKLVMPPTGTELVVKE